MTIDQHGPYAEAFATLEPIKAEALARGGDAHLVSNLTITAALQRHVNDMNRRILPGQLQLAYPSFEEFTLRHGQPFPAPTVARPKGLRKGRNRQCFSNAAHAALDHQADGWQYVEGYASGVIPAHHAWCLDADGNVVETTWREAGDAYLGVVFPDKLWRMKIATTRTYGVFDIDLLREPYTPEAFMARLRAMRAHS